VRLKAEFNSAYPTKAARLKAFKEGKAPKALRRKKKGV
jgi:hypothetical protein